MCIRDRPEHPPGWPGTELHHHNLQTDGSETSQRNIKKTKPGLQQIMKGEIENRENVKA